MLISKNTIENINDLRLSEVIGKFIDLKKSGSGWSAKSPWTDEKTGSFMVSDSKNVWKDFSTNYGGAGAVSFVMKLENIGYAQALTVIAERCNIVVEYDDQEKAKKYLERQSVIASINDINFAALEYFHLNREKIPSEHVRMKAETMEEFNIGFAPKAYNGLVKFLLTKGFSSKQIVDASLASEKEPGKVYDFFQNRVVFPVSDANGRLMGFSGRDTSGDAKQKYMNSRETEAFRKSELILGFDKAKQAIREHGFFVKVEGNYDVTACYEAGVHNVGAPLGTAFTKTQAEIIKKQTSKIVLFVDNDDAGLSKIEKDTTMLLELGFTVSVFIPEIEKQDPFDCVKAFKGKNFLNTLKSESKDAVEYLAEIYFEGSKTIVERSTAEKKLSALLSLIADNKLRNSYTKAFSTQYKVDKRTVEQDVKIAIAERTVSEEDAHGGYRLPSWLDSDQKEEWNEFLFYEDSRPTSTRVGYFFATEGMSIKPLTNFVCIPLFQIKSMSESKRIMEIFNGKKKQLVEMPNKGFSTMGVFEEVILNFGNFRWDGGPAHFKRLRAKLLPKFQFCEQIQTLGWHKAGFYSFANGIVDRNFKPVDANGICYFGDSNYYLPAFSKIHDAIGDEDEDLENDKLFSHRPGKVSFHEWAKQFNIVFGLNDNGKVAILHMIACLFRDIIFQDQKYFPHLFSFGTVQTGKSTMCRSIFNVFFGDANPINLTSDSVVAISRKVARVRNAVQWLDEYDNSLKDDVFNFLKRSYDGIGRETGNIRSKKSTDITKVESGLYISGQYMPTRDDQSLFTRSLLLEFTKKAIDYTNAENREYQNLKKMQDGGLSQIIVEVIRYRDLMVENFSRVRFEIESALKDKLNSDEIDGRVLKNYTILLACHSILAESLQLPWTYTQSEALVIEKVKAQSEQINDSNILASFWKMLAYLVEINEIRQGDDFIVVEEDQLMVRESRDKLNKKVLDKRTSVLYIRFTKIHPRYMEHMRRINQDGISDTTLKNYMRAQKSFLGNCPAVLFEGRQTSAYAFDYHALGVELIKHSTPVAAAMPNELPEKGDNQDLPF